MADSRANDILGVHSQLMTIRQPYEQVWQEIAERVIARKATFNRKGTPGTRGERRDEKIFDAAPGLALDRFAAAFHSLVTPRNQKWHLMKSVDEDLAEDIEVQRYYDELNRRLFAARYSSNFDNQAHECYYDAGSFGNMGLFVGERPGRSLFYRNVPMDQLFFAENEFGIVDLVHRDWYWTARQAYQRFGEKLPSAIKTAAQKQPNTEFRFIHCVKPRTDADVNRDDYKGMEFVSYYVAVDFNVILEESGFRTFPYMVGRYAVTPGDVYGRGPVMTVLPDIKMLNEMNRTTIQAAQLAVLPPLLAHRDGILDAIRVTPAAINYGGVDDNGRQMIQPMGMGGQPEIGLEMMEQKRQIVNDALWNTLFQILVDNPSITATEAMLRAQEKGALLAPTASRTESEFLSPMIRRELDLLAMADQLPEMPEKLAERGGLFETEYASPLSRARRAEEGVAILRTFEQLTPMAQIAGPKVFRRFNADKISKKLFEINGGPADCLYTDEELAAQEDQEQQGIEAQTLLEAAPVAASAAKDLAQAGAIAGTADKQMAPAVV